MSTQTRRVFSKEYKEKVVNLMLSGSKSQIQLSKELGINVSTLQKWKKAYLESQDPEKVILKEATAEERRLRKELQEAKLEIEILKKAMAYFSRDQV